MISRVRRFIVDRMLWRGRMGSGGTEHDDDQDGIRQQEALMTRRIHLQLAAIVSNDGTRCAAECPHRDGGYGHCTAFDRPLVMDLGHGAYDRCPTCIAAEQAAALVPSCEGVAWAVGDRVHIAHDLSDAVVARVPYVNDDGETVMTLRWLDNGRAFSWFMGDGWRDLTRLPADDHNEEKR